jgi:S1-C subfamily serine protease
MSKLTPVVTHLSGRYRGTTQRLSGDQLRVGAEPDADVIVDRGDLRAMAGDPVDPLATLERQGEAYELKARPEAGVFVNGKKVEYVVLDSGDLVQIGPDGPALRFRVYEPGAAPKKSVRQAMDDCVDTARYATKNPLRRALIFLAEVPWALVTQTTRIFRAGVVVALAVLVGAVGILVHQNRKLEARLAAESAQVDDLFARAEQQTFTAEDFLAARSDLEERVHALEERQAARMRVIAAAAPSVVFLQGAYGFVDPGDARPLRMRDPTRADLPLAIPGVPFFTFEGDGEELEVLYTGTAFLVGGGGKLLTNRHIAEPWEFDPEARAIVESGIGPVMRRFIGYLPGVEMPFEVELVRSDDTHDVALLRCAALPESVAPLPLAEAKPRAGDEVIVLGYPAGIGALVARADPAFVEQLQEDESIDFWEVARRLSTGGHVAPLATVGVVGQVTDFTVVYDAETTHGGSGGPVLDLEGRVVAVNAAILPQFGGSNLGVPATEALRLLE